MWKQELDRKVADEQQGRREIQRLQQHCHEARCRVCGGMAAEESQEKSKQLQALELQTEELRVERRRSEEAEVQAATPLPLEERGIAKRFRWCEPRRPGRPAWNWNKRRGG